MPNLDKTGPMGQGPLTGRRRGRCGDTQTAQASNAVEESSDSKEVIYGLGRGGRPRGGGGFKNRFRSGSGQGSGRGRGRGFGK